MLNINFERSLANEIIRFSQFSNYSESYYEYSKQSQFGKKEAEKERERERGRGR